MPLPANTFQMMAGDAQFGPIEMGSIFTVLKSAPIRKKLKTYLPHHLMIFDPTETKFGQYKPEMHVTKTIEIAMSDEVRFTPVSLTSKKAKSFGTFLRLVNFRLAASFQATLRLI